MHALSCLWVFDLLFHHTWTALSFHYSSHSNLLYLVSFKIQLKSRSSSHLLITPNSSLFLCKVYLLLS